MTQRGTPCDFFRRIDTALDLSRPRSDLAPHYSSMGRLSIDPELMIWMLVVGACEHSLRNDKAERFSGLEVGCLKALARRSSCRS
jgi:hypothetical protein